MPNEPGAFHIAVTKKYIFLMFHTKNLGCYDRYKHCKVELFIPPEELENKYMDRLPGTFLFGIENDNKLFILPYGNRGLEVDLQTLVCQSIDIFFLKELEKELEDSIELIASHKERNFFAEITHKSVSAYLKYGVFEKFANKDNLKISIGENIYYTINCRKN